MAKCDHRIDREAGRFQQHAKGVAKVGRGSLGSRPNVTAKRAMLLIVKCDHGIDFHRPTRGQETSEERGRAEQENDRAVGDQVGRPDSQTAARSATASQRRLQGARPRSQSRPSSGFGAGSSSTSAGVARRAPFECRSPCPLRDVVGDHAVDPDGGENDGDRGEDGEQSGVKARLRERLADELRERSDCGHELLRIDLVHRAANHRLETGRRGAPVRTTMSM